LTLPFYLNNWRVVFNGPAFFLTFFPENTMKRSSRRKRQGFTLVELLVVIAIIGILIGMLLPAVQQVREAARRMQCGNNLRQLMLANLNYESAHQAFPMGYTVTSNNAGWGWGARILPFIEQNSLFDELGVLRTPLDALLASPPANLIQLMQTPINTFLCPSDSGWQGNFLLPDLDAGGRRSFQGGIQATISNYKAAAGAIAPQIRIGSGTDAFPRDGLGLFMGNNKIAMAEVTDGTSNTIALGEADTLIRRSGTWLGIRSGNTMSHSSIYYVVSWAGARINQPHGAPFPNSGNSGSPDRNPGLNTPPGANTGYGSLHPGGANFCYADGSVHFLSEDIDHRPVYSNSGLGDANLMGLYQRLMCRNDGVPLNNF